MSNWYQLDATKVLELLSSDAALGLSTTEANLRLEKYGFNALIEPGIKKPWQILWEQLSETLVLILLVAAAVSAFLGEYKDGLGIIAIVVLIAVLGFSQEYQAQKAIATLKNLSTPNVKVKRNGKIEEISARYLVPGDVILLEAEDIVPADCRILQSLGLRTQEAALTGMPEPVDKDSEKIAPEVILGERCNIGYMGTVVTYGQGEAVVTETAMATELGSIAQMIHAVEPEPTPLQKRLDELGKNLAVASLGLVGIILILGLLRGEDMKLMFLTAITLLVAALPEGLPAVVTIALTLGARQMLKRRALIRNLPAVETLGSVTTICSGKTGTLTVNRMTVTVLDVAGHQLNLTADMRLASPDNRQPTALSSPLVDPSQERPFLLSQPPALALLLAGATLCNNAQLESDREEPRYFRAVGDPSDGALVMAAARQGLWKADLETVLPRIAEIPFDSRRQRMTTVHHFPGEFSAIPCALEVLWYWNRAVGEGTRIAFCKGRVASLLEVSQSVWVDGGAKPLDGNWQEKIMVVQRQLVQQGLRVMGVAFRLLPEYPDDGFEDLEQDLTFIGLLGMTDPARPEARDAILTCKAAGIRPVMVTGDHPLTAWHLARELDIANEHPVLTSADLAHLSIEQVRELVGEISVYARVSPQNKFDIVRILQSQHHVVAMTGDGVNDAPALKAADIGVAMGISGTDVAKDAADMVLLDDNFATIVAAVKEGRVIYDNIRKFIKYLLSSNVGELWVMLLAPLLGMPLPLLPLQILWVNLATDGLPALALGVEPAERDTMKRSPYPANEGIFSRGMGRDIIWIGLLLGMVSILTGYWYWRSANPAWQTMLFTTLTLSQMGNALAIRSERDSLFQLGVLSNLPLLAAVLLTLLLQIAVIYLPFFQNLFATVALSASDLFICLVVSTIVFWGVELKKWLMHHKKL
ncbi:cation-translocating P-type ATPase [Calothrix sp. UHCC 0171]|uniref:cation-translocating P-type ATPase n=1 Tax=Calothrix sp. UHCC 0171 TaxID=3110245 RepID=UPI002B2079A2|nr:cation-translocating P-type ATPase [Calothrix sp. UHCC 0171]MEA5572681.1 cation-translocating P-type ATPase [Calothrix sp. UHCC 0171]